MVSRLDRLFILLDTGSDESVRLAAARQIGEVQRIQPNDLDYLLEKIKEYSTKPVWGTRVAAGQATRHVIEQVKICHDFDDSNDLGGDNKVSCKSKIAESFLNDNYNPEKIIRQFDLKSVKALCPNLLSVSVNSTGNQNEAETSNPRKPASHGARAKAKKDSNLSKVNASRKRNSDSLQRQRQLINKELGISMDVSLNLGVKSTDIVSNDDLEIQYTDTGGDANPTITGDLVTRDTLSILRNIIGNHEKAIEALSKANYLNGGRESIESQAESGKVDKAHWPLEKITNQYLGNLFHPSWEVRHGAAIALRELVRIHGKSAGRLPFLSKAANDILNDLWLIDMSLFSLCVLVLDKFGDFLFDQVVAPVRENSAQLLSCCLANTNDTSIIGTISEHLLTMLDDRNWEIRHGGMLGLKYSLNVVNEVATRQMLIQSFDHIFKCLADPVDDVSAEAAATLAPVKDLVISIVPDKAPKLVKFLWDHLADLDELTASTGNLVQLLASLITSSSTELKTDDLTNSMPRLWSLLSHSSTSVRVSVIRALIALVGSPKRTCLSWMPDDLLSTALRLIFQRTMLENTPETRNNLEQLWSSIIRVDPNKARAERIQLLKVTSQYLNYWLCLVLQPLNVPIDRSSQMWLNINSDGSISNSKPDGDIYIGSFNFNSDNASQQRIQVTRCRMVGAKLLGILYASVVCDFDNSDDSKYARDAMKYLSDMFIHYLSTKSANQRIVSSWTIETWAHHLFVDSNLIGNKTAILPAQNLVDQLHLAFQDTSLCYDELAANFTRLQQEARDFVATALMLGIEQTLKLPASAKGRVIYNLNQINSLCHINLEPELDRLSAKKSQTDQEVQVKTRQDLRATISEKQASLKKCYHETSLAQKYLASSVLSSVSCAMVAWRIIPQNCGLLINHLLESIEIESDNVLQEKSIDYLVVLFDIFHEKSKEYQATSQNIIERLIASLDKGLANSIQSNNSTDYQEQRDQSNKSEPKILLLDTIQRRAQLTRNFRKQSAQTGTIVAKRSLSAASSIDLDEIHAASSETHRGQLASFDDDASITKSRGCKDALRRLTGHLSAELPVKLPKFWTSITSEMINLISDWKETPDDLRSPESEIDLVKRLHLLNFVGESLHPSLRSQLGDLLGNLITLLGAESPYLRHYSAQCIGMISNLMLDGSIRHIKADIIPMLESDCLLARCGSIETIALIIESLQMKLVGLTNVFILHVLRRMSDQFDQVRLMATHCFGKLLSLMPLNIKLEAESGVKSEGEHDFIEQLLDPKKLDHFVLPFEINAQLRSYQQDGLNWLAFLNRYNLHGILCDEMGLGKTLMTICMVAADHHQCRQIGLKSGQAVKPSLIVCPSTLTEHWLAEIDKFLPAQTGAALSTVAYSGALNDRLNVRKQLVASGPSPELVVASYDIVRNDIDFFKSIRWNYCVLDEGHMIKNCKTKLSQAIRVLSAKHRLILSGTPIQNNVTELWSLFDFLMPGLLGSERHFSAKYSKPILQSRDFKCSSRELEAGALAMESLHRQVLPFILRRLKEDVLDDLPPKILQDYYCELSPLQAKLYEDFTKSSLCKEVTKRKLRELGENQLDRDANGDSDDEDADPDHEQPAGSSSKDKTRGQSHIFKALQYLRNVCNHPKLVLTEQHPQLAEIRRQLQADKSSLDDISHSSKLKALKQLLIDCGIGDHQVSANEPAEQQQQEMALKQSVVNQHRALIFCQARSMVDIVECDLLRKHLANITYLRLDGSVPIAKRHSIVTRFNNDPSIDVLLLTTQIGGLGLNLTCADTVIFVEHDWNPTKDLQAMDRAHRIGQRKVVNVYRLITKATLEEKIMGLQKFKTMVSNTVINQDNAGLATMRLDQLLDIFEDNQLSADNQTAGPSKLADSGSLDLLPELWDQQQYETEYDLGGFVSSLRGGDH